MNKYYTGVGSRNAPNYILNLMTKIAKCLDKKGYILRTGDASGSDFAFFIGTENKYVYDANDSTNESMLLAKKFHPKWYLLTPYGKKLHSRNAFQVLGINLNKPSKLLICWTPDGCVSHRYRKKETGGTGTAISIADHYNIPIFNLKNEKTYDKFKKFTDVYI